MAAVAASPAEPTPYSNVTLNGTGFALSTAFLVAVTTPQGSASYPVTSDGTNWYTVAASVASTTFTTSDS